MRRTPRSQAGFTLIEVLVALALMALVSLMAWRGLASVSGARDLIAAQAEDTDAIVRTLGQMARDVELSYTGPAFDSPGLDAVAFTTGLRLLPRAAGGQTLEILRPDPDGNGLWQRVHWQVRADGLWRASGPSAPRSPLPAANAGVLLLPGVRILALRAWVPGVGWVDANASFAAAPTGLEIAFERGAPGDLRRYTRVLELP
ncbi:prepilin-type N-terminal cleavage/methylation domain-containing protein [Achromobacter sp. MFA1 R4]|uniref:prepilin-type N-terminal cleavage/methylation domain-containing protein n=1 Tax=Achromobacter sp. MFA1 R4 TaxID=1881016 RepID=UPI00097067E6|nr:prepilin-type N-terminal cleavage/methylation domain-containing protein [Achromobacter sp. MFA1 R4]